MSTDSRRGLRQLLWKLVHGEEADQASEEPSEQLTSTPDDGVQLVSSEGEGPSPKLSGSQGPSKVAFTQRAYTAMLSEVLKKTPVETGGILLGYRDASEWTVVESLDPGPHSIHQLSYFEYDQAYVTHQVNRVRNYYEPPLDLLGLWHRHPGSFDIFSGTDDGTNLSFARMSPEGAISGLVNVDPCVRLTLYRVSPDPLVYTRIPYSVLDAGESGKRAPLRGIEGLTSLIESRERQGFSRSSDVAAVPQVARLSTSTIARWIDGTIEQSKDALLLGEDWLVPWSDDRAVDTLEAIDSDVQHFEVRDISLALRYSDSYHLQLMANDGQQEQVICQFVLMKLGTDGADILCVKGASDDSRAIPYTPGFLQGCINRS